MLQQENPGDYVIATGETNGLSDFVAEAFSAVGLDWHDYVETDPALLRRTEIKVGRADPGKAREKLGWTATYRMRDVVREMMAAIPTSGRA